MDLADRFAGCLLGQALGDALGFPVEGRPAAVCTPFARALGALDVLPEAVREPFAPGQYSDDTQLARELAASLVARGGFDPADYAARIAALFDAGRVVGHGPSTEAAARRLIAGVPWHAAGTPGPVAGNGGAMRVAPLALVLAGDAARLQAAAADQARITHADPRCAAGARVVARTVVAALQSALDAGALCAELALWAGDDEPLAQALHELPRWLQRPVDEAAAVLCSVGVEAGSGRFGIAPHVTPSVLWSVYAALRHPRDYPAAIAVAIAPGGDVDTTAAMTGAIVGAHVGLARLPKAVRHVHDRGGHDYLPLVELATALASRR